MNLQSKFQNTEGNKTPLASQPKQQTDLDSGGCLTLE